MPVVGFAFALGRALDSISALSARTRELGNSMVILRNLRAVCSALILLGLSGNVAWSQSAKTFKIIVPFPPGGSATILARLLAEQISRVHGPTILIENRPGAGASIGYEAVARALPDEGGTNVNFQPQILIQCSSGEYEELYATPGPAQQGNGDIVPGALTGEPAKANWRKLR